MCSNMNKCKEADDSAIKAYRDRYPFNDPRRVGLKEAKDTVEEYMAKNGYDH